MRTALIKGQSRYGLLRCFIDDVANGIAERGDEPVVLDLAEIPLTDLGVKLEAASPLDLVFSINIVSDYRDPRGRSIFEITGAPHVTHFVDHPLHHLDRLRVTPKDAAVLFIDYSHVRALPKLLGPERFAYAGFCPHGALGEPAPTVSDAEKFCAERPITALIAGTYYAPGKTLMEQFPDYVKAVFAAAIEAATAQDWLPTLDALDEALTAFGLPPDDPGLGAAERDGIATMRSLAYIIDDTVRARRRARLVADVARSGIPLTIVGEGYGEDLSRLANVDYRGAVPTTDIPRLMRSARAVLNANANFGEGSHERPLTAMLAGAVAITDHSTFYDDAFEDGREISLYHWSSFEKDWRDVAGRLSDPQALFAMAGAGLAEVAARHRWKHRIDAYYAAGRAAAAANARSG